jgi:hypothetical protein
MPVPTSLTDLSTTPGSNSPPSTDTLSNADDYLRAQASIIKRVTTGVDAMTSPDINGGTIGGVTLDGNVTSTGNPSLNLGTGSLTAGNINATGSVDLNRTGNANIGFRNANTYEAYLLGVTGGGLKIQTGPALGDTATFSPTGLSLGSLALTAGAGAFSGSAAVNVKARSVVSIADTSAVAQSNGGGVLFRGVYTGSTLVDAGSVQAYKINATDGDYGYGLRFTCRANGGDLTDYMNLSSAGLAVSGNGTYAAANGAGILALSATAGTNGVTQTFTNTGGAYTIGIDNAAGGIFGSIYAFNINIPTGRVFKTMVNGAEITRVSSAGLAVTGSVSTTGNQNSEFSNTTSNTNAGASASVRKNLYNSTGSGLVMLVNSPATVGTQYGVTAANLQAIISNLVGSSLLVGGADNLYLATGGVVRATLGASGNLLVNATSVVTNSKEAIGAVCLDATGPAASFKNTAGSAAATVEMWNATTTGDGRFVMFTTEGTYTQRGSIDYNRAGGAVRYNTSSDATLKNIIGDAPQQKSLDILASTRLREYSWKEDATNKPQIGVIAQELYETYKGAVSVGGEYEETVPAVLDDEGNEVTPETTVTKYRPWAVDKTAFTFHLVAGYQHLKAENDSLKAQLSAIEARLAALESA